MVRFAFGVQVAIRLSIIIGQVVAALVLSTFVAAVAGIYPAWRAASLDPVVALRRD